MSRSVTLNYERYRAPSGSHLTEQPEGHDMPRYSDALESALTYASLAESAREVTAEPAARARCGFHCERPIGHVGEHRCTKADCAVHPHTTPAPASVDVEIIIHRGGVPLPVVRFTNVPLSVVDEAVAHVNDNSETP